MNLFYLSKRFRCKIKVFRKVSSFIIEIIKVVLQDEYTNTE